MASDVITSPLFRIQFNVQNIQVLSPALDKTLNGAMCYINNIRQPLASNCPLLTPEIPAMLRRRMSPLSKLVVQLAITLSTNRDVDFAIFSSRHGELHRTVAMLQEILAGNPASPTAFSQSVHNTASGLFTITTKQAIPVTSLSGGVDSFHYALIEAASYLTQHPEQTVLVVDADLMLPDIYSPFESQQHAPYALGLLLTAGDQVTITHRIPSNDTAPDALSKNSASAEASRGLPTNLPPALIFYHHWQQKSRYFTLPSPRQHWQWQRAESGHDLIDCKRI